MRSLFWKEWHEQRWKLAFGSLILAAFALIGLRARIVADSVLLEWVCVLAVMLLPVLASTGLLPAERSDGTLPTLLALPVDPRIIFIVKTLTGILLCGGPLIVAGAVSVAVAGWREMSSISMIDFYLRTLAVALTLFFWMFALTIRLPSETRAALTTMGILIGWSIITLGLAEVWRNDHESTVLWIISPFVYFVSLEGQTLPFPLSLAMLLQAIVAGILLFWAARQLAAEAEGRS
jgi:hypothetical protein